MIKVSGTLYFLCFLFVCRVVSAGSIALPDQSIEIKKQKTSTTAVSAASLRKSINYHHLKEVGSATFTFLFWDVYRSSLYTTSGAYPLKNNQQVLVLNIEYLRDIEKSELIEQTIAQWQHIGLKEQEFSHFVVQLEEIWPNITAGDSLALLINDETNHFYLNNQYIGVIQDNNFGQIFIDIWLSKKTSQPKLRKQLIGRIK